MIIGVDLDDTIYGHPEFFREFIPAMIAAGHTFVCTSGHLRHEWDTSDRERLRKLGINPDLISPHLLRRTKSGHGPGPQWKGRAANRCDIVFDDDAKVFQQYTKTPIFCTPINKPNWKHR